MSKPEPLAASIDLDAPGKRIGHLELTWSDNAHAYGVIAVPIALIKDGEGPSVLVSAGVHGDEFEGLVIARRLIGELSASDVRGRLVVMPAVNLPAVQAVSRCSPIDGANMNRAFPGDATGGPSAQIADFIERRLLPGIDLVLDLHSGGTASVYEPSGFIYAQGSAEHRARKLSAAHAFGAPVTVVVKRAGSHGSLSAAAERVGVPLVATELAGGGGLDPAALDIGWRGALNLLRHAGLIAGRAEPTRTALHLAAGREAFVMAPIDGLFEPSARLGDRVEAGAAAGRIWPTDDLARQPVGVRFAASGRVLARRSSPRVARGDYLFHTGTAIPDAEFLTL